jgi:hypothetical protein
VVEGFGSSPSAGNALAADDWKEIPPPKGCDHDHCEFCWETFESPAAIAGGRESDAISEGYATVDDDRPGWICDRCFEDFKDEFGWTVRGTEQGS